MQPTYSVNLKQLETKVRLGYHHLYLSIVKGERDLKLGDAAEVANALDLTLDEFHDAVRGKLFRADSRQASLLQAPGRGRKRTGEAKAKPCHCVG